MRSVYLLTLLLTVAANMAAAAPAFPPVTLPNSELRTLESNDHLVKQEQKYLEKHKDLPVRLFMAAGGAEELMTPGLSPQ